MNSSGSAGNGGQSATTGGSGASMGAAGGGTATVPRILFDESASPGSPPIATADSGGNIAFTPGDVYANRISSFCNGMVTPADSFWLYITEGKARSASPKLYVTFGSPTPPLDTPITLYVEAFSQQYAMVSLPGATPAWYAGQAASGKGIQFSYESGTPAQIDAGPFDSVVVTLLRMPAKDGDPLTIRLRIHFVDGKLLDQTFSALLTCS